MLPQDMGPTRLGFVGVGFMEGEMMSEATREFFIGHPWCSNVPRDEAVRAAEDAAAASQTPLPDHRELPESFDHLRSILHGHLGDFGEALKVVRRMNKKLESLEEHCKIEAAKVARLWILHEGVLPGDHLSASPSCASRIEVLCNTCRGIVGLEPTCPDCNGAGKVWKRSSTSEPWKYADEDPPCFRVGFDKDDYERKAAATRAAAAASGVLDVIGDMTDIIRGNADADAKHAALATLVEAVCPGFVLAPAASGAAGTGWLDEVEREALEAARDYFDNDDHGDSECVFIARVLKQILARSSPPEVVRPPYKAGHSMRDGEWIAALAAAGVTCKEVG